MVYLYKCAFTNAEMFSDAFPVIEMYDGFILAVKSSIVDKKAMKFDIGDSEEVEDKDERVNDIADGFKYNQSTFTKGQFGAWLKPYLKKIADKIRENQGEEKAAAFQKASTEFAKSVISKFDTFEFFMNEENDMEGAIAMSAWENSETDKGPTFYFFKDGMTKLKI